MITLGQYDIIQNEETGFPAGRFTGLSIPGHFIYFEMSTITLRTKRL